MTVDDLIAELEAARLKAMRTKQLSAAVGAILGKAKLLGFLTERVELDMTIRKPMREPFQGTSAPMTLEEWQKKFAPKLLDGEPIREQSPKKGSSDSDGAN